MFLTEANVLHYLSGRGFAGPEFVVRGEYTVRNLSRRNNNFRVTCGRREFLVKQAGNWDRSGRSTMEREADLCRRAATDRNFAALRPLVPEVYSYDPANSILIFEFLPGEIALSDAPDRFVAVTARRAGEIMSAYHGAMQSSALAVDFPGALPGFFHMHRWPRQMTGPSDAQVELVRLVQRHAAFGNALEAAAAWWRASALIHGDWKVENCLVSADGARLHVIDWELAGWGDPCWDVATLLQSWWNYWVRDAERYPLEAIRPALRAFLGACRGAGRAQVLAFAAVRMLQTAWESLKRSTELDGEAVRLAQVSLNILTQPEWAREELLGDD